MSNETSLTRTEKTKLAKLESIIQDGLDGYAKAGQALKAIRDSKLYRDEYGTFEAYCLARWDYSDRHARRLIDASEVAKNITEAATKNRTNWSGNQTPQPATESQARELSKLPPEEQADAWEEVVATTATPTAAAIKGVVEQRKAAKAEQPKPSAPPASIVLDLLKREVPEALRDKYAVGTELAALGRKFDAIKREVEQFRGVDGADFLPIQTIEIALHDLKGLVAQSAYWTACPRCSGKGCSRCDGTGFLPKSRKGKLSREDKEILGI